MKKDNGYAEWGDKANKKEPPLISPYRSCAPIGKLILNHLSRCYPADENTSRKRTKRQKNIRGQEVAEVEEALAKHRDVHRSARQRADNAD